MQFGRAIGSFQALKHRMADLTSRCRPPGPRWATPSHPRAGASRAGPARGHRGVLHGRRRGHIQLHGGIAITWEHDMHLYLKRAYSSAQLFGPPREQLRALEDEVFWRVF